MALLIPALLEKYGVDGYFNAHEQNLQHVRVRRTPSSFLVLRSCSFSRFQLQSIPLDVDYYTTGGGQNTSSGGWPNADLKYQISNSSVPFRFPSEIGTSPHPLCPSSSSLSVHLLVNRYGGFTQVSVSSDKATITFYKSSGALMYSVTVTASGTVVPNGSPSPTDSNNNNGVTPSTGTDEPLLLALALICRLPPPSSLLLLPS